MVYTSGFSDGEYNTGVVYALAASSGKVQWTVNLTKADPYSYAPLAPAIGQGRLYVAGATPTLYALDVKTGKQAWEAQGLCEGHLWMVPAMANGVVYAGCDAGELFAVSADTGKVLWKYYTNGAARSPVVANGRVFFGVNPRQGGEGADQLVALQT